MTTPNIEELRLLAQTLEFSDAVRCSIQRAADLLQSQAERIKELESEVEMWKATANAVVDFEKVQLRAQLRAQLAGMTANTATDKHLVDLANDTATRLLKERDTLRAEIAGTAAVEPVATLVVEWVFHEYDNSAKEDRVGYVSTSFHRTAAAEKMPIGKYALFTRPMPAQRLTELKLLMLTTAYEQGVGKGIQRRDCNPYAADTEEHAAWKLGYEEGLDKPMPAQDVTELVDAAYDEVQRQIVERYRVEKLIGGFWPCCVKAGDGTMDIFVGSKKQAEHVRQALQTACLDGAFMTSKAALSKFKGAK